MQNMKKRVRMAVMLVVGISILSVGHSIFTLGEEINNERQEEEEEQEVIEISARGVGGIREFHLVAPRDDALPVIFSAIENVDIPDPNDEAFHSIMRFHAQLLSNLKRNYRNTKYHDSILSFFEKIYVENPSASFRGEVLFNSIAMDLEHPITERLLEKAITQEGDTETAKFLRSVAQATHKYIKTGDEELLEKWDIRPEELEELKKE